MAVVSEGSIHDGRMKEELRAHILVYNHEALRGHWEWHESLDTSKLSPVTYFFPQDHTP